LFSEYAPRARSNNNDFGYPSVEELFRWEIYRVDIDINNLAISNTIGEREDENGNF
jgi:hypothetical protein